MNHNQIPITKEIYAISIGKSTRTVERYMKEGLVKKVKFGNRVLVIPPPQQKAA